MAENHDCFADQFPKFVFCDLIEMLFGIH